MRDASVPFTRVDTRRRAEEVVSQLAAAVQDGVYGVGDRLPPERDLAVQMGVSRTSVREGLAILSLQGIVERRVGSGTYVASTDPTAIGRAVSVVRDSVDPYEVFEWQQVVEPAVTALAVDKLDADDLARLRGALQAMLEAIRRSDRRAYSLADRRFHFVVAEGARNDLVTQQMTQLFEWMAHQSWLSMKRFSVDAALEADYFRGSLEFHEALYAAIVARDVGAVFESYRARYRRIRDVVFGEAGELA